MCPNPDPRSWGSHGAAGGRWSLAPISWCPCRTAWAAAALHKYQRVLPLSNLALRLIVNIFIRNGLYPVLKGGSENNPECVTAPKQTLERRVPPAPPPAGAAEMWNNLFASCGLGVEGKGPQRLL